MMHSSVSTTLSLLLSLLFTTPLFAECLYHGPMENWASVCGGLVRRFVPLPKSYAKGGELVVDITVGWQNVVQSRPAYPWSGVVYTTVATDPQGRRIHPNTVNLGWGSHSPDTWRLKGIVPEGATNLEISIGIMQAKGEISFGMAKVSITPCDPAKRIRNVKFSEHQKAPVDLDFVEWYGDEAEGCRCGILPHHGFGEAGMPPLRRGFAFFRIDEPGMTFDRHPPISIESGCGKMPHLRRGGILPPHDAARCRAYEDPHDAAGCRTYVESLRVTPGEVRDFFFGVYAPRVAQKLTAEVGPFETSGFLGFGKKALGGSAVLNRVRNWRQCGDMGGQRSYTVMPEVIFPWKDSGEDLPAGTTAQAMLQLVVPDDAAPGIYASDIVFSAASGERPRQSAALPGLRPRQSAALPGERHTLRVEVEVLPFKLIRPKPTDYELIAHIGQYGETPERFETLAKMLKRRGFESMLIATHYGSGGLKLRKGSDGKLEIESFDRLRYAVRAYRAAGMTGTFFVHLSDKLEVRVAEALGIPITDAHGEQTNMIPAFGTGDFRRHVGEAFAAIKAECAGLPLAVLAMDEPNFTNRIPRASYEIANIRAAGIPAALYGDQLAYWNVKPDYLITTEYPNTAQYPKIVADLASRPGTRLYLYEGSGSYHYAYGSMYVGRFNHGWGDYLAPGPCHGHTAWNFLANAPTDFDGIRHFATWAQLNHFDGDMNMRMTLQFEAICEGYLDRCYINTLEKMVEEGKGSRGEEGKGSRGEKGKVEKCREVVRVFDEIKAECARRGSYRDPIRQTQQPAPKGTPVFTNADMDEIRSRVTDLILELRQ